MEKEEPSSGEFMFKARRAPALQLLRRATLVILSCGGTMHEDNSFILCVDQITAMSISREGCNIKCVG